MPVKLIIFDLDGTLVDTAEDITYALNRAIAPLGRGPLSVEETTALIGEGTSMLVRKALGGSDEHAGPVLKSFLYHYSSHLSVSSALYPGVSETLWRLSDFQKVVLSNKREDLSRRLLSELGVADYFTHIRGSDTLGARKPSPEPVRQMLELAGAGAAEAIMVGDSPYDVQAARDAGVAAVAVTYGYRDRDLLGGADHVVEEFAEIIPLLVKLKAIAEKRREPRYRVPRPLEQYIEFTVVSGGGQTDASLLDLSRHGVMFRSPQRLRYGEHCECKLRIPRSLSNAVLFGIMVRHCEEYEGEFLCGAEVQEIYEEVWFRVFHKTLQFISQRSGKVF